jgi:hypothetical protein
LATYVRGLHSVSLAAAAVGAGFRYIEGDSIGAQIQHPSRVIQFSLTDLYRSLAGRVTPNAVGAADT